MAVESHPITSRGQWLSLREHDVTASDAGALFGLHPYRTLLQVYLSKTGAGGDQGDNAAMRRGRIMEPGIAVAVQEDRPDWRIEKATEYLREAARRMGATPDYYIHGDPRGLGVLQCKSVAPEVFERDWLQGAPQAYVLQTLQEAMLKGADFAVIGCLIDNRAKDLFIFDVPRHPAAEALICKRVAAFWQAVEAGNMPVPDYDRDAQAIAQMFPRDNGESIDLSGDNMLPELLDDRGRLKDIAKDTAARLERIDAEIKHKIGSASEAHLPGWKLTHKLQKRKAYEVAATEFRVLRITRLNSAKEAA